MFDAIIIGSGISSTIAAWELKEKKLLILDVGIDVPKPPQLDQNIFELRHTDTNQRDYLIGNNFESLINVKKNDDLVSLKLKAPFTSFVIKDSDTFCKVKTSNFSPFMSFAYGGLANAWGAGVYRYSDYDLKEFPINSNQLSPFYNELTDLIGICGENDDLQPYFDTVQSLQKSIDLNKNGKHLYNSYKKRKKKFKKKGIVMGRPHLTVLTSEKDGRRSYNNENTSFFTCYNPSIFTPPIMLDQLIKRTNIVFKSGILVKSFEDSKNGVTVKAKEIKTNKNVLFEGKKLLIGAGTINSGKILLQSFNDFETRLPLMDNPVSFIPFVDFRAIGCAVDSHGYEGGQLILIYEGDLYPDRIQGSFYSYISPLRADIIFNYPFSIRGNLSLIKFITPALSILQLFYPDSIKKENHIQLNKNGILNINYNNVIEKGRVEKHIIKLFSRVGFFSIPHLVQYPMPGNSIHYAGTVPMKQPHLKYYVNEDCLLNKSFNVYFIDGSSFPSLAAKNLTFTLMANAMRVARKIKQKI